MKKYLIMILFAFISLQSFSQNQPAWADLSNYKHVASYTQNATWVAPPGVTKIVIEAIGGGGGGAAGGGGGGAEYIRTEELTVTPGSSWSFSIGTGGTGASTALGSGANGTSTNISGPSINLTAYYGNGALSWIPGTINTVGLTGNAVIEIPGEYGNVTIESYAQRSSGEFVTIRKYGDGGRSGFGNSSQGRGASFTFNTNTQSNISLNSSLHGSVGCGGGGGPNGSGAWGQSGGMGMVIIHY